MFGRKRVAQPAFPPLPPSRFHRPFLVQEFVAAVDPSASRWAYVYRHFHEHDVSLFADPSLEATTFSASPPSHLKQLTFVLERVGGVPIRRHPSPRPDGSCVGASHEEGDGAVTFGGFQAVRVRLTQGWPQLLSRDDLDPGDLSLSRQQIVLTYTGEQLYVMRTSLNDVRLFKPTGGAEGVVIERYQQQTMSPQDTLEMGQKGLLCRMRDVTVATVPSPSQVVIPKGDALERLRGAREGRCPAMGASHSPPSPHPMKMNRTPSPRTQTRVDRRALGEQSLNSGVLLRREEQGHEQERNQLGKLAVEGGDHLQVREDALRFACEGLEETQRRLHDVHLQQLEAQCRLDSVQQQLTQLLQREQEELHELMRERPFNFDARRNAWGQLTQQVHEKMQQAQAQQMLLLEYQQQTQHLVKQMHRLQAERRLHQVTSSRGQTKNHQDDVTKSPADVMRAPGPPTLGRSTDLSHITPRMAPQDPAMASMQPPPVSAVSSASPWPPSIGVFSPPPPLSSARPDGRRRCGVCITCVDFPNRPCFTRAEKFRVAKEKRASEEAAKSARAERRESQSQGAAEGLDDEEEAVEHDADEDAVELAAVAAAKADLTLAKGDAAMQFNGQKHYMDTVTALEVREWQMQVVHQTRLIKQRIYGGVRCFEPGALSDATTASNEEDNAAVSAVIKDQEKGSETRKRVLMLTPSPVSSPLSSPKCSPVLDTLASTPSSSEGDLATPPGLKLALNRTPADDQNIDITTTNVENGIRELLAGPKALEEVFSTSESAPPRKKEPFLVRPKPVESVTKVLAANVLAAWAMARKEQENAHPDHATDALILLGRDLVVRLDEERGEDDGDSDRVHSLGTATAPIEIDSD